MSESAERKMTALDDFVMAFVRIGRDMSVPIPVRNFATNCRDRLQKYILASSERREPPAPLISWAKEFIAKHNRIRKKFYRDVEGDCPCDECSELKHILARAESVSEPAAMPTSVRIHNPGCAIFGPMMDCMGPKECDCGAPPATEIPSPTLEEWFHSAYLNADLDKLEIPARVAIQVAKSYAEHLRKRAASVSPVGPEPHFSKEETTE